jgi:hypothetical protein
MTLTDLVLFSFLHTQTCAFQVWGPMLSCGRTALVATIHKTAPHPLSNIGTLSHQASTGRQMVHWARCWVATTTTFARTSTRAQMILRSMVPTVAAEMLAFRSTLTPGSAPTEVALWACRTRLQKVRCGCTALPFRAKRTQRAMFGRSVDKTHLLTTT